MISKVAILGCGAMGSIYASYLSDHVEEVWAIDPWEEHIVKIKQSGLKIDGPNGSKVYNKICASTNIEDAKGCDLYIIATKGSNVGHAAKAISQVMREDSLILTIQNGLGSGERIAQFISTTNVLLGVADGFGASIKGPGHIHHNAMKLIRLGEVGGGISGRLEFISALWLSAGFQVRAFDDINQLIWEKFLCNVTLSGPCTIFDCSVGDLMANTELWAIAIGAMKEAYVCGLAEVISFSFEDPTNYVTKFAEMMPSASPSMRLDHLARQKSEIDSINGMVPVLGKKHDIQTPFNQTITGAVRAAEMKFEGIKK